MANEAPKKTDDEPTYIYRPYKKRPDGTLDWAKNHGKKAWRIPVKTNDNNPQG